MFSVGPPTNFQLEEEQHSLAVVCEIVMKKYFYGLGNKLCHFLKSVKAHLLVVHFRRVKKLCI